MIWCDAVDAVSKAEARDDWSGAGDALRRRHPGEHGLVVGFVVVKPMDRLYRHTGLLDGREVQLAANSRLPRRLIPHERPLGAYQSNEPVARILAPCRLVIVDELGYVPLDKAGADLLFGFISQRYKRRSLVVTTNLPFARWSEVFLDPTAAAAVIDRVVHHATVLQTTGGSFRLAAAKQNQAPAAGKKGAR